MEMKRAMERQTPSVAEAHPLAKATDGIFEQQTVILSNDARVYKHWKVSFKRR